MKVEMWQPITGGNFEWNYNFKPKDVYLIRQENNGFFIYLKKNNKKVSLSSDLNITWTFFSYEIKPYPSKKWYQFWKKQ